MKAFFALRVWLLAWLLVVLSGMTVSATEVETKPLTGTIQWIHSYEEGQKLARESGKPMFVVFRCER